MLIGKIIQHLRKSKNMTLSELSKKSGVQIATLSRIEHEKMTGTLESHIKIAEILEVDITELYKDVALSNLDEDNIIQSNSSDDIFIHSEQSSYEILSKNVMSKKMMPILLKINPNGKTNPEQFKINSERFLYIVEGNIIVHINENTYALKENNSFHFNASLLHYFKNETKRTAKILSITTPVSL